MRGLYRFNSTDEDAPQRLKLLGSGAIMNQVLAAQKMLKDDYGFDSEVWAATSYQQLHRDGLAADRWNRLNPTETPRTPEVTSLLDSSSGPIVAVTDYMRAVPDQIAPFVPRSFTSLGTDGYGRSDTREALRSFFEVNADHVVVAVLSALSLEGRIDASTVTEAIERYGIDPNSAPPWLR